MGILHPFFNAPEPIDYTKFPQAMEVQRAYNAALSTRSAGERIIESRSEINKLSDYFQSLGLEKEAIRKICQKALFEAYKEKVND